MNLSENVKQQIDAEVAKYPFEEKQAALLAALTIVQNEQGWISEQSMALIADYLEIPKIRVAEVATFYSMYELSPVGTHKICLCTNISCMLRGSESIAKHIQARLGIGFGETTRNGKFTLKEVECLAACGGAPMMQVDGVYYENLTADRVDSILDEIG